MLISLREPNADFSKFVNIDELFTKPASFESLFKIYKSIESNIHSFESCKTDNLKILNEKFKIALENKSNKKWIKIKTISTMGFYYLAIKSKKKKHLASIKKTYTSISKQIALIEESQKEKKKHKLNRIDEIFSERKKRSRRRVK